MAKVEIEDTELAAFKKTAENAAKSATALTALQESVAKLETNNQALLQEKKDAKDAAQLAIDEAAKKSGDVEALEKSWQEKIDAEKESGDKLKSTIANMTSGNAAALLAKKLALPDGDAGLLPHITPRLTTEYVDGHPIIRILDKDGKPSAMNMDDLEKELRATPYLAGLLVGSKANGSGDVGNKSSSTNNTITRDNFNTLNANERMKHFKEGGKVTD